MTSLKLAEAAKHIRTKYFHARAAIAEGRWQIRKVHTSMQLADFGTKIHDGCHYERLRDLIDHFDPARDYSQAHLEE